MLKCSCGGKIYDGMVWHGKKWDAAEWVLNFGMVCVHCQAHKEKTNDKQKVRKRR